MKIDLSKYKAITNLVASICKNNSHKSHAELMSIIAVASGAPVVVAAYYYAAHIGGLNTEIQQHIDSIVKFYGYKEIIGIEELLGPYEST